MKKRKTKVSKAASSAEAGVGQMAQALQAQIKDTWTSVQQKTKQVAEEGLAYARNHPLLTNLAVFGVGVAVGLFLRRRPRA